MNAAIEDQDLAEWTIIGTRSRDRHAQSVVKIDLIAIDKTLASLGLRSRRGKSSANALPWVGAFSGSHPLFHSDSGVSVAVAFVRSHISGPGVGRSGGSISGGPIHTCTPWMRPSDI